MLLAKVWTYWLAVPITFGAVMFGLALIVGYLTKVVRPKYPRGNQES